MATFSMSHERLKTWLSTPSTGSRTYQFGLKSAAYSRRDRYAQYTVFPPKLRPPAPAHGYGLDTVPTLSELRRPRAILEAIGNTSICMHTLTRRCGPARPPQRGTSWSRSKTDRQRTNHNTRQVFAAAQLYFEAQHWTTPKWMRRRAKS